MKDVARLRAEQSQARERCSLRTSINTYHSQNRNPLRPTWNRDTTIKQQPLFGSAILKRNGDIVQAPKGRYDPKLYEGTYSKPFSAKKKRCTKTVDRVLQDRLYSADTACRLREAISGGRASTRGGSLSQTPPQQRNVPRVLQNERKHRAAHGAPLNIFDAEYSLLPSHVQLTEDATGGDAGGPSSLEDRRDDEFASSYMNASSFSLGSAGDSPHSLHSGPAPLKKSGETSARVVTSRPSQVAVNSFTESPDNRWLSEDEELQRAANEIITSIAQPHDFWPTPSRSSGSPAESTGPRDRSNQKSSPSPDISAHPSTTSRRSRSRNAEDLDSQDAEAIAAHYYQQLLDECPPEKLFEELYK